MPRAVARVVRTCMVQRFFASLFASLSSLQRHLLFASAFALMQEHAVPLRKLSIICCITIAERTRVANKSSFPDNIGLVPRQRDRYMCIYIYINASRAHNRIRCLTLKALSNKDLLAEFFV